MTYSSKDLQLHRGENKRPYHISIFFLFFKNLISLTDKFHYRSNQQCSHLKHKPGLFIFSQTWKALSKEHSTETCPWLSKEVVKIHLSFQGEQLSNGSKPATFQLAWGGALRIYILQWDVSRWKYMLLGIKL